MIKKVWIQAVKRVTHLQFGMSTVTVEWKGKQMLNEKKKKKKKRKNKKRKKKKKKQNKKKNKKQKQKNNPPPQKKKKKKKKNRKKSNFGIRSPTSSKIYRNVCSNLPSSLLS